MKIHIEIECHNHQDFRTQILAFLQVYEVPAELAIDPIKKGRRKKGVNDVPVDSVSPVIETTPLEKAIESVAPESTLPLAPNPEPISVSIDDVSLAVKNLSSLVSFNAARDALQKFGAKRVSELKPVEYRAFIIYAERVIKDEAK